MSAGSLSIDVLANTQNLVKGMNKAESVVAKSAKNMTRALTAFGAIFVGGKLTAAISRSNAEIDKLGKTASKLGIGTKELGALQFAAEQSGVKVETLNMALQRSTRRIAEAAKGTGESVKALNELGLSAEDLNRLSPDEQLNAIADAMEGVTNQSDKVRLSMKLFDSSGVDLVNMLKGGSAALKEYARDAESLGILLDDDMVKKVEAANDAQNRLSKSLSVVGKVINVQLAPYIIYASNILVEMTKRFSSTGESSTIFADILSGVARGVIIAFQSMQTAIDGWIVSWDLLIVGIQKSKQFLGMSNNLAQAQFNLANSTAVATQSFDDWIETLNGTDAVTLNLVQALKDIDAQFVKTAHIAPQAFNKISAAAKVAKKDTLNLASTVDSSLTSAFRQSLDGAANWGDAFKGIIKDVMAQMFKLYLLQKLTGVMFGGGGTKIGPVRADGSFANGGTTPKDGTFLVGERGPELVNLPGGSNITPNHELGGVTVNVINNSSAGVEVQESNNGDINVVISQIANDITRGTGPVGGAIESRYGLSKI